MGSAWTGRVQISQRGQGQRATGKEMILVLSKQQGREPALEAGAIAGGREAPACYKDDLGS